MTNLERLYEHLGELLYAIAMADGIVQNEEISALEDLMQKHPWGSTVKWSFEHELNKKSEIEVVYKKVISFCHGYGPSPVYNEFISAMETIAAAANGTEESESKIIKSFSTDLIKRFQQDLDRKMRL